MRRTMLTLLVLLAWTSAVTPFAPAPLPRQQRRDTSGFSLAQFQGTWKIVAFDTYGPNGQKNRSGLVFGVRIKDDLWTFLNDLNSENAKYTMVIDNSRRPTAIDFFSGQERRQGNPYMLGIIRRKGDIVELLYLTTTADKRATSFENVPEGWWMLTLERIK